MSLIRKSDVKNHLSTRTGATVLPTGLAIPSGPNGYSKDGDVDMAVNASGPAATLSDPCEIAEPVANTEKAKI